MHKLRMNILLPLILLLSACGAISDIASDTGSAETGSDEVQAASAGPTVANPPTHPQIEFAADTAPPVSAQTAASAAIPVITEAHQGLTYGTDQLVIVFVEGFQPGEMLSISAMHETEGIVKSDSTNANERGEAIIYHYVQHRPIDEGAYPEGAITFRVRSSTGTVKTYAFNIDYAYAPQPAQTGCGTYPPSPIQLGGTFVAWCSGFAKDDYRETNYQTQYSISNAGDILLSDNADVMADGLVIVSLSTESSDPAGNWDITIGDQAFQVQVVSP